MSEMDYQTLRIRRDNAVCFVQLYRPEANNAINERLIDELNDFFRRVDRRVTVVVLEGLPDVFCFGMDFQEVRRAHRLGGRSALLDPAKLYDLWLHFVQGPFVVIAYVRGKVNAGGVGFVAASDIVIADQTATFSLSELLFGLMPACVMPFLIRRVGPQHAHYMTLLTQPVHAEQALSWGLVDACGENGDGLLHKHLLRLRRLSKEAIGRYKQFRMSLPHSLEAERETALTANRQVFSDPGNLENIVRYVESGVFPWEEQ